MRTRVVAWLLAIAMCTGAMSHAAPRTTAADSTALRAKTQALFDAVTSGDSAVWLRTLAPDCIYADEDGVLNTRAQLVASIKPLPATIWGKLDLETFAVHPHGTTAVTTFIAAETEGYFGQVIHARYLTTHVWQRGPKGWTLIGAQSHALLEDPPAVTLPPEKLDEYTGVYALTADVTYTIRRDGYALVGMRTGRAAQPLKPELADLFFVPGQPRLRKVFQRDKDGHITGFVERRESWDVVWKKVP